MRNNKKTIIILAVCMIAALGTFPVFAAGTSEYSTENELWQQASVIFEMNSSILPEKKAVVWQELSPAGEVITSEELTYFYSETDGSVSIDDGTYSALQLKVDVTGDSDALEKRNSVNDGLLWTPFDSMDDSVVKVLNTGRVELVNGTECSVFEYDLYRAASDSGYNLEKIIRNTNDLLDDYEAPENNAQDNIKGFAWIDGNGVLRRLVSSISEYDIEYTQTVEYDFDGKNLYPVKSVIEGSKDSCCGDMIVQSNFRATEDMEGFWIATDFYR